MAAVRRKRLDPSIFHLPVEKMREGYYSDKYFVRAREVLLADHHRSRVHEHDPRIERIVPPVGTVARPKRPGVHVRDLGFTFDAVE